MELTHILVVSDLQRSVPWYRDVVGATLTGEYGGTSAVFNYDGAWRARGARFLTEPHESASAKPRQVHTDRFNGKSLLRRGVSSCSRHNSASAWGSNTRSFRPGFGPDVVAAVSNAGGCGVLGASGFSVPYLR